MVLVCLGGVLVLGGALTVLLNPAEAMFGWFAYTPLNGELFPAVSAVTPEATAGWTGVVAGLLLWAFCAGWLVGRRRRDPRR